MKKIFFTLLGILVIHSLQAQFKGPNFGIKGGFNFSNIIKTDDDSFNTDYHTGFHAGVFVSIPIIDRLGFQPELLFSQKGYEADRFDGHLTQTTNWIEIPIQAKINAAPGFNILLGPQVSFLTKTNNKFEGALGTVEQTRIEDDADKFKKSILGGTIGISLDIGSRLILNGRYALDFQKNNENGTTETPEFKNQVWQVGLSIKFL